MKKEMAFLFSVCFLFCLIGLIEFAAADSVTGEVITGDTVTGKATQGIANASITIYDIVNFTIDSPQNTTYVSNTSGSFALNLNVSWNIGTPSNWRFTLVDLWLNVTINSSTAFTPNTTIYSHTKSHNLTVTVENEIGAVSSRSVVFYVNANNTVPVIDIPENELFVCEDNPLDYSFNVTDAEDGGINVGLSDIDPFFISPQFFTGYSNETNLYSTKLNANFLEPEN